MRPRASGFALFDLLLAVTIAGILAAVGVSMLEDDDAALDAAARGIAADLLTAQALALETRLPLGLVVDSATDRTWFAFEDGTAIAGAEARLRGLGTLTEGEIGRLLAAKSRGSDGLGGVRIAVSSFDGGKQVTFASDGSSRNGGYAQLGWRGTWLRVHCQAVSGRVTVTAP